MNRLLAWMLIPRHGGGVVQRYGTAAVSVTMAAITALLLQHYNLPHPFTSFSFAAIAITFWYAGTGPGLLAIALSCSALSYFFTPLKVGNLPWDSYLVIYGVFGFLVSWFSSSRIRAERSCAEARDALEIRVAERTADLTTANQALQQAKEELSQLTQKLAQENLYLEDENSLGRQLQGDCWQKSATASRTKARGNGCTYGFDCADLRRDRHWKGIDCTCDP